MSFPGANASDEDEGVRATERASEQGVREGEILPAGKIFQQTNTGQNAKIFNTDIGM